MSCSKCISGTVHDGETKGTETNMHGLNVYITKPPEGTPPKGVIVYIPDAFGWRFINNRLLADKYAQNGNFLVLIPDLMNGKSMDTTVIKMINKMDYSSGVLNKIFIKPLLAIRLVMKFLPWIVGTRPGICHPRATGFISALRTNAPPFETKNLKIGVAGFCWGGKHAVLLAQDDPAHHVVRHESQTQSRDPMPLIDCAFTAHPSMLNVPKDIEAVKIPLSVAVGETDMAMSAPKVKAVKEILEVKKRGDHEVNIIPGAIHGFAVRLDPKIPEQVEHAEIAERQAIDFFTKWLA